MINREQIKITDIIYVNHLISRPGVTYEKYGTDNVHYCQILYKLSGEACVTVGAKTVIETVGDIRFTPNFADLPAKTNYSADITEPGESINVAFTTDVPIAKEILVKRYSIHPKLKALFEKMQKCWYYKHSGYYCRCMSLLYEIFAEMQKAESTYTSSDTYRQILPAVAYIDDHFTKTDVDCADLASLCGISQTYMIKLFHRHFGMSPNRYIIAKKMDYACDLLKTKQYRIHQIAQKTGYANTYYFSRAFKNFKGVCPSEYV
ncbi:MAG: helix-turn-helix transcriptional regulator [Clostridia bacterium]|nr:helix-turn-helix transcriptional regulator [Clostridia bacterium]